MRNLPVDVAASEQFLLGDGHFSRGKTGDLIDQNGISDQVTVTSSPYVAGRPHRLLFGCEKGVV